jgi:hypothetical protein
MAYYSEEDLMEHLYEYEDVDEENSYVSYLLRQKRKRKEKFLRNNAYRDEYSRDFNDDFPYDDW